MSEGNIAEISVPQLFFQFWQKERSGMLRLQKGNEKKDLYFKEGNVAVERDSFPGREFLKALVKREILKNTQIGKCESYAAQKKISLLKSLVELNILPPTRLWNLIVAFFKANVFPLFDWSQGRYSFDSGDLLPAGRQICSIQTLELILQGVRQMQNHALIESFLPSENEAVQVYSPYYLHLCDLEMHEKYLLNLLHHCPSLKDLYFWSELGKKESQKVLFALLVLGLVRTSRPSEDKSKKIPAPGLTPADSGRILEAFNEKCSYIYKYISKELGPIALNVLAKCLEELKPHLSPSFQNLQLNADGKVVWDSAVTVSQSLSAEDHFKKLLKCVDEILAAEVLAVKKTLGNEHEAALVKNLKKIGAL